MRRRRREQRFGAAALDTLIVSGTSSADEVVGALELTTEPLSIVPLFETVDDLDRAPQILEELLETRGSQSGSASAGARPR